MITDYRYRFAIYIVFLVALLLLIYLLIFRWYDDSGYQRTYYTLFECSIEAPKMPYFPCMRTYGVLIEPDTLEKLCPIVKCESKFNPEVCSYAGCKSGMGLCQIIPSTLKHCEEMLGKKLDPFNPKDNLECGVYLLENEGDYHWDMSKICWAN